jgi:ketosteroid isomerase-like protein
MPTKALQEAKQALEELNLDQILSAYAEKAVFEDIPAGLRIEDRSVLRDYFEKLFASPGVDFSCIRIFDGGDFAAIEWIWSGLKRDTGESFQVKGASVIELADGKIARESIYYDPASALIED